MLGERKIHLAKCFVLREVTQRFAFNDQSHWNYKSVSEANFVS